MTQSHSSQRQQPHPDDIVLWPDGTWATLEQVRNGDFDWMSDDYEIIDHLDARLKAAGVIDETM
ncbi:hypothetical protein [Ancylobacter polymorphus]|uniref:Uncharacterized protein n=1 Tax=Ancylobacter polymorphus TaxID=223390 RepID=A0ABU0BGG3_9HYPH|nr:hypothetical protein [Ancylobacter polymorphus]MDQ0304922.1 hypothetical protein [Ancylobacter polymorphus]